MDNAWSDHLQNMENLKENVFLRKYQNLDPADEYKRESLALFEGLLDKMRLIKQTVVRLQDQYDICVEKLGKPIVDHRIGPGSDGRSTKISIVNVNSKRLPTVPTFSHKLLFQSHC